MIGVSFGDWHSYNQGGLILVDDDIGYPEQKNMSVRRSVSAQPNQIEYSNRKLSFTFRIPRKRHWQDYYDRVSANVNGKLLEIVRDIEPGIAYIGICSVGSVSSAGQNGEIKVDVDAQPFKLGRRVTQQLSMVESGVLTNIGTQIAPCVVNIVPTTSLTELVVSGLARNPIDGIGEEITLYAPRDGETIVIDGENKTVKVNGSNAFSEVELWEFPTLEPGANSVTLSSAYCNMTVTYRPRYI